MKQRGLRLTTRQPTAEIITPMAIVLDNCYEIRMGLGSEEGLNAKNNNFLRGQRGGFAFLERPSRGARTLFLVRSAPFGLPGPTSTRMPCERARKTQRNRLPSEFPPQMLFPNGDSTCLRLGTVHKPWACLSACGESRAQSAGVVARLLRSVLFHFPFVIRRFNLEVQHGSS
jgi:hypothetical protein